MTSIRVADKRYHQNLLLSAHFHLFLHSLERSERRFSIKFYINLSSLAIAFFLVTSFFKSSNLNKNQTLHLCFKSNNTKTSHNCFYQNQPNKHAYGAFWLNVRIIWCIYSYCISTECTNIWDKRTCITTFYLDVTVYLVVILMFSYESLISNISIQMTWNVH